MKSSLRILFVVLACLILIVATGCDISVSGYPGYYDGGYHDHYDYVVHEPAVVYEPTPVYYDYGGYYDYWW